MARELTKLHEEILRSALSELYEELVERPSLKGEFVGMRRGGTARPPQAAGQSRHAVGGGPRSAAHTEKDLLTPDADPDEVVDEILALLSAERYRSARRLAAAAM